MKTALIFDLDGTLINSLPDITHAANQTFAAFGTEPLPQATIAKFVGHGFGRFLDKAIETFPDLATERPALEARFMANYIAVSKKSQPFEGVAPSLDRLSNRFRLGLCTNKATRPTDAVLQGLGWENLFSSVVAGDTLPTKKPNPAPLLFCRDQLKTDHCLFVGDSEVDAETARAADIPFFLYTEGIRKTPVSSIPHDVAFSDWLEFENLVEEFLTK